MASRCAAAIPVIVALAQGALALEVTPDEGLRDRLSRLELLYPTQDIRIAFGEHERVPLLRRLHYAYSVPSVVGSDSEAAKTSTIIRLDGVIEKGDAEKIKTEVMQHDRSVLVISGPGGNFAEALRIGEYINSDIGGQDPRIGGIIVLNGTQCLSACALIAAWAPGGPYVEHGAELGFHLPFLPAGRAEDITQPAGEMLNVAYDISLAFNELVLRKLVTPDLIRAAYKHRSADSFLSLKEGWQYAENGFVAVGERALSEPAHVEGVDMGMVADLCMRHIALLKNQQANFSDWEYSDFNIYGSEKTTFSSLAKAEGHNWFLFLSDRDLTNLVCRAGTDGDGNLQVELLDRDKVSCSGPMKSVQSESTCHTAAPQAQAPVSRYQMMEYLGCMSTGFGQGEMSVKKPLVIRRDVNMRDKPDIDGQVVRRALAGENVVPESCQATDDKQTVWFQVVGADGARGWISGRYADRPRGHVLYQSMYRDDSIE